MMARTRSISTALTPAILGALAALITPDAGAAQIGGAYDLSWNAISSGGGTESAGGVYLLGGSVGQLSAGAHAGGAYTLDGGFWVFGSAAVTGTGDPDGRLDAPAPAAFRLHPAAPNPFARETTIAFDLPRPGVATARIYNASGALVRTLLDGPAAAGNHRVAWTGTDDAGQRVSQGIYLMRLQAGAAVATRKLVLTR